MVEGIKCRVEKRREMKREIVGSGGKPRMRDVLLDAHWKNDGKAI